MREQALQRLKDIFGYAEFRGQQADIIDQVATGGDALVLMPTGGGKSLCYQIPAIARQRAGHGIAVVVSPLIALMQDQVEALRQLGDDVVLRHPHEIEDPREVRFAICWQPGEDAFAPYPNLRLAMSIAAGVDALLSHPGLSAEVQCKLERVRPQTVGQAQRIPGMTPAAISLLLVHLERARRGASRVA